MLVRILLIASICLGDPCPEEYSGNMSHKLRLERFCLLLYAPVEKKPYRVLVIFSDESYHSFFFMKNITGIQREYSVRMEQDEICVCRNIYYEK